MECVSEALTFSSKSFRATFRNNIQNQLHVYRKSHAILVISPTQPYYKDQAKFSAIIELINASEFKTCQIVIGDTNYQHTLKIKYPNSEEAYAVADKIGLDWINKNQSIYSKLNMPYDLTRWREWVLNDKYAYHRKKLDIAYDKDCALKDAFFASANDFVLRNAETLGINELNRLYAFENCLEYLKEECAIMMPLWAEMKIPFIIYPSKMLQAMEETYRKLVIPHYPVHPHWLSIRCASK
ncbi:MAG: hypothetical protein Q8M94_02615 [Ignavibacteria bacterium]|nr:hypothetical protein [Ignavibacteria bacterium]